jgi:glutamine amidotransferase class II-like protein/putative metal-binding protein
MKSKTIIKALSKLGFILMFMLILSGTSLACRMYGVISNDLPNGLLQNHLVDAPNSLWELSHDQLDGWGIAYYPDYADPALIERGATRAYNDSNYDTVVEDINDSEPKITVAHIRTCTSGCCDHANDTVANPHPFYRNKNGKMWTFTHNGGVSKTRMDDLLGDYLIANPPNGSDIPACNPENPDLVVDSELYFLFVLKKIEENGWHAVNGIVEAVTSMIDAGEGGGINFIMSDGTTVWGFRKGNTLSYSYDAANGYSAVASQPTSSDGAGWTTMIDYQLVVLTAGSAPLVMDVRDFSDCVDADDDGYYAISPTCPTGTDCDDTEENVNPGEAEICDNGIDDDCDGDIDCDDDDCAGGPVLKDSDFNANVSDDDLRDSDPPGEYWYESREHVPALLTLDEEDIGGNNTKKAGFAASSSDNAYLTQQFSAAQTGIFAVQWDIYVDNILDDDNRDRGAMMMIGDGGGTSNGPNSTGSERFVYMSFYSPDGGGDAPGDTMSLIASEPGNDFNDSSEWKVITSGLSFDAWHTIRAVCNLNTDTYDVYVNDAPSPQANITAYTPKTSVTHISFAQWGDGSGGFYVDNVSDANLAVFAAEFGRTDCSGNCLGDSDGDGDADGKDFAAFCAALGTTCP